MVGKRHVVNHNLYVLSLLTITPTDHQLTIFWGRVQVRDRLPNDSRRPGVLRIFHDHPPHLLPALDRSRGRVQAEALQLRGPFLPKERANHANLAVQRHPSLRPRHPGAWRRCAVLPRAVAAHPAGHARAHGCVRTPALCVWRVRAADERNERDVHDGHGRDVGRGRECVHLFAERAIATRVAV